MRASVAVVAFCLSFQVFGSETAQELTLRVGESLELSSKGLDKIAVGDPSIADVTPGKELFTVVGLRAGTTKLLTWRGDQRQEYVVTVTGTGVAPPKQAQKPAPPSPDERISMNVGESRVLIVPQVTRVSVGDPEIVDISIADREQLLLDAKKAGRTTLLHWTSAGTRRAIEITVR